MFNISSDIYQTLTPNERGVLHYILSNEKNVSSMTAQKLSDHCNVSKTVVINFAQKIGFEGFNELRFYLKNQQQNESAKECTDFGSEAMHYINRTLMLNQDDTIDKVVDEILNAGTIYVMGRGQSKHMSAYLAHLLMIMEVKTINIQDYNHFAIIAKSMNQNDLLIAISLSGETALTVETAKIAHMNRRKIVSFTAFSNNTLSSYSDYPLYFMTSHFDTKHNDTIPRTPLMYIIEIVINKVKNAMILLEQQKKIT